MIRPVKLRMSCFGQGVAAAGLEAAKTIETAEISMQLRGNRF